MYLDAVQQCMCVQMLGSALKKTLDEDERSALLYQLIQMSNASAELVNTLITLNPSNYDDNMILVLGALAKNNSYAIQSTIVNELLKRLKNTTNIDIIAMLTYALGNTGSKLALDTLLCGLQYDSFDIQISAIRSLSVHLDQPVVQEHIINLLESIEEDKILEEILMILLDSFNNDVLTSPNEDLLNATVKAAIALENSNLYELLIIYLQQIKTEKLDYYVVTIKQQHNYGDVKRDTTGNYEHDSRVKRGSGWDESNSRYDLVATYSQRRSDVSNYPYHKAYLYDRAFGYSKLTFTVGIGAFAGGYYGSNSNKRSKVYAKYGSRFQVFGKNFDVGNLEYYDKTTGNSRTHKWFAKFGSRVHTSQSNTNNLGNDCDKSSRNLWSVSDFTIFNVEIPIFVFVGTLNVYLTGYVGSRGDASTTVCACTNVLQTCADVKLSLKVTVGGGASASLLVRM